MKMTVVPAQVTTVEDRIIGNLGFSQILLLVIPIFISAGIYVIAPPFLGSAVYKYVTMGIFALLLIVLSIRIKGKIVAFWLVTILRYNVRPKYYLFNKNVTTLRENYPEKKPEKKTEQTKSAPKLHTAPRPRLDIPSTAKAIAALENPAANIRFETGKKGDLHVRLTEIES